MPVGKQPIDPRIVAALPHIRAYMKRNNHRQKDVIRLTNLSQPQVSKFLAGERHRVTSAVLAIFQYAGIDVGSASPCPEAVLPLSQSARQVLEDNPRAAALVARLIEAMVPVLSNLPEPASAPKEGS
jgi:predicted XRE-type DNA-binding protein